MFSDDSDQEDISDSAYNRGTTASVNSPSVEEICIANEFIVCGRGMHDQFTNEFSVCAGEYSVSRSLLDRELFVLSEFKIKCDVIFLV